MREARNPRFDNPKFWSDFVIGQSIRKYRDLYENNIYYGAGVHRAFLSFDTSVLKDKRILSAKLVMLCFAKNFANGGLTFSVRIYSGNWERINADFISWNVGTVLVVEKYADFVPAPAFDEYILPTAIINTEGKTQLRICSSREEDQIDPIEPLLADGTCTVIDHSKIVFELINWDTERTWLEIGVEP